MDYADNGKEFSMNDMPLTMKGFMRTEYHLGKYTYLYVKEHEYLFYDGYTEKIIYQGTTKKDVVTK